MGTDLRRRGDAAQPGMPFISPPKRALLSAPPLAGRLAGPRRLWLGFFIKGECSRGLARFRAAAAGLPPLFICRGPAAAADAHRTLPCKGLASGGHTWPKTAGNELSERAPHQHQLLPVFHGCRAGGHWFDNHPSAGNSFSRMQCT
jgi:hypothetical protein